MNMPPRAAFPRSILHTVDVFDGPASACVGVKRREAGGWAPLAGLDSPLGDKCLFVATRDDRITIINVVGQGMCDI